MEVGRRGTWKAWIGGASRARIQGLDLVRHYLWVSYGRSLRDGNVDSDVHNIKEVQDTYVGYHRSE